MRDKHGIGQAIVMITQLSINMLVPVFMCLFIGIWLDKRLGTGWLTLVFLILGIMASIRSMFITLKPLLKPNAGHAAPAESAVCTNPETLRAVIHEVRKAQPRSIVVAESAAVGCDTMECYQLSGIAKVCEEEGADGVSLVNTFKALAIDIKNRKPVFENVYAGLSGPAIKPIALRMVHEVCKNVSIPVFGMGGITTAEDAIEFIMAGATCVQIGTANFMNPRVGLEIIEGINDFMEKEGIKSLDEIRGII